MQQDNSYNYIFQAVQQELNIMVSGNQSNLVRSYVNDLLSNSQLNDYMHELTSLCNNIYVKTAMMEPNTNPQQLVGVLFRGQVGIGYLHMAQWLMVTGMYNNMPPNSIPDIKQKAAMFYNLAVEHGVYNNQQQQSQFRQPQFSSGFKPQLSNDLSQHGFNNNNNKFNNASGGNQPTKRVSYRAGNVTTVNQNTSTDTNTPPAPVNAPEVVTEPLRKSVSNVEPPKSDIKRWLEYHYERLNRLNIKGPDYASSRPYDIMLLDDLNADGEKGDLWVLSNIVDVKPTFIYGKPQYNVYNPDVKVRYMVFNFDGGYIREGFLKVEDHPDMAYAALEQGAKPIKKTRTISDLYTAMMKQDVPKIDVIDPDSIEAIMDDEDDHVVVVTDEVSFMLGKMNKLIEDFKMGNSIDAVMCDSLESGEMNLDVFGDTTGTAGFIVCKPYVVTNEREIEMINRFNMCGNLNDVKLVFDQYDPKDVEISRMYHEMNERFTQIVGHITWCEYRIKPTSFARDIGDLLDIIRDEFGNDNLSMFIKETRGVIDTATLMLTGDALLEYKAARNVNKCKENSSLVVFGKLHVVNNIDAYSNQLTFNIDNDPTTFNLAGIDDSDPAQKIIKSIGDIYKDVISKFDPNSVVYLRTKDNKRIRLSHGLSNRNLLYMSIV